MLPEWVDVRDIAAELITGGITNELTLATPTLHAPGSREDDETRRGRGEGGRVEPVVVRVFGNGTDAFLDRAAENRAVRALNAHGFGATCLATFANGRVEEALTRLRPMTPAEMPSPGGAAAIAGAMARLHSLPLDIVPASTSAPTSAPTSASTGTRRTTYDVLREWLRNAKAWDFRPAAAAARGSTVEAMRAARDALGLDAIDIDEEVGRLAAAAAHAARAGGGVARSVSDAAAFVPLHNDALAGNFLVDASWDAKSGKPPREMRTIDFEYMCVGPRGFDVANHFIEHAGFECDWSLLPDADTRFRFYRAYQSSLAYQSCLHSQTDAASAAAADSIESLELEVALMTPVSHLWWGLWAVMQATMSAIDFDYLGYAAKRLEAFRETRTTSLERRVQVTS